MTNLIEMQHTQNRVLNHTVEIDYGINMSYVILVWINDTKNFMQVRKPNDT